MPRHNPKKQRSQHSHRVAEATHENMTRTLDELASFEDFKEKILPAIREDVASGMTATQLREKWSAYVQACQLTDSVTAEKASERIAARKDILDRTEGKAMERKESTHRFEKLEDDQLDALLKSKMKEVVGDDDTTKH